MMAKPRYRNLNPPTMTKNMAPRRVARDAGLLVLPRVCSIIITLFSKINPSIAHVAPTPQQNGSSSSDEYGAPSRKRKRTAATSPDVRVSSRGGPIPNYADDGGFRSDDYEEDD